MSLTSRADMLTTLQDIAENAVLTLGVASPGGCSHNNFLQTAVASPDHRRSCHSYEIKSVVLQSPLAQIQEEEDAAEADAMEIYAAVKPSGRERALPGRLPELTSTLHAHQRRAAAWMLDRETGAAAVRGSYFVAQLVARSPVPPFVLSPSDKRARGLLSARTTRCLLHQPKCICNWHRCIALGPSVPCMPSWKPVHSQMHIQTSCMTLAGHGGGQARAAPAVAQGNLPGRARLLPQPLLRRAQQDGIPCPAARARWHPRR